MQKFDSMSRCGGLEELSYRDSDYWQLHAAADAGGLGGVASVRRRPGPCGGLSGWARVRVCHDDSEHRDMT
jgi:hypothetical protein